MTILLGLLVVACVGWVVLSIVSRRGSGDPQISVDGFSRALHALAPDSDEEPAPRRRGWRRERS